MGATLVRVKVWDVGLGGRLSIPRGGRSSLPRDSGAQPCCKDWRARGSRRCVAHAATRTRAHRGLRGGRPHFRETVTGVGDERMAFPMSREDIRGELSPVTSFDARACGCATAQFSGTPRPRCQVVRPVPVGTVGNHDAPLAQATHDIA